MPNDLGNYNPIFFANEALQRLYASLGMASRVHRRFEQERASSFNNKGETIRIRRPGGFVAKDAPASVGGVQDLATERVEIRLDHYRQVTFKITDQELAYTQEQIINEHVVPAAHALAKDIDTALNDLSVLFPSQYMLTSATNAPMAVTDITGPRRLQFNRGVPLDVVANNHYEINGDLEERMLSLLDFSQYQGAGDAGQMTQTNAELGVKFGHRLFANQNVSNYTGGSVTGSAVVTGAHAIGVTSVVIGIITTAAGGTTVKRGDSVMFAGDPQLYVATADGPVVAGGAMAIAPPLKKALLGGEAAVIQSPTGTFANNLMFHTNAMALVFAPLPETGNRRGAEVATLSDPFTQLSLRSRMWYEGLEAELFVSLDVLFGVAILDHNMATRCLGDA